MRNEQIIPNLTSFQRDGCTGGGRGKEHRKDRGRSGRRERVRMHRRSSRIVGRESRDASNSWVINATEYKNIIIEKDFGDRIIEQR